VEGIREEGEGVDGVGWGVGAGPSGLANLVAATGVTAPGDPIHPFPLRVRSARGSRAVVWRACYGLEFWAWSI